MAAGLGFKTFNTGDVLTAGDTNGYLMQGVWVFASAAARTSAVTSPQEGNVSFLKDTNSLEIYDGAAWVAYGSGDITGVTAGTGISGGGSSGTVTVTNSMATAIDAKGDLIVGTGADTFDRLAVGTNNQILVADSTTTTGLKWAAASGGSFVKTSSTSWTSASSANFNNLFDSTYKNYMVVVQITSATGDDDSVYARLRTGATNTNTNYSTQELYCSNTTVSAARNSGGTDDFFFCAADKDKTYANGCTFYIFNPFESQITRYLGWVNGDNVNGTNMWQVNGHQNSTTSFDGIGIFSSNNTAGTITVYGLEN